MVIPTIARDGRPFPRDEVAEGVLKVWFEFESAIEEAWDVDVETGDAAESGIPTEGVNDGAE